MGAYIFLLLKLGEKHLWVSLSLDSPSKQCWWFNWSFHELIFSCMMVPQQRWYMDIKALQSDQILALAMELFFQVSSCRLLDCHPPDFEQRHWVSLKMMRNHRCEPFCSNMVGTHTLVSCVDKGSKGFFSHNDKFGGKKKFDHFPPSLFFQQKFCWPVTCLWNCNSFWYFWICLPWPSLAVSFKTTGKNREKVAEEGKWM